MSTALIFETLIEAIWLRWMFGRRNRRILWTVIRYSLQAEDKSTKIQFNSMEISNAFAGT